MKFPAEERENSESSDNNSADVAGNTAISLYDKATIQLTSRLFSRFPPQIGRAHV